MFDAQNFRYLAKRFFYCPVFLGLLAIVLTACGSDDRGELNNPVNKPSDEAKPEIGKTNPNPELVKPKPEVISITPITAFINKKQEFIIEGKNLSTSLSVTLEQAGCELGKLISASKYRIHCTHSKAETLNMQVKSGAVVLKSQNIVFSLPAIPVKQPPVAPKDLTVKQVNGGIRASWSPVRGATSYNLYYAQQSFANIDVKNHASLEESNMLVGLIKTQKQVSGLSAAKTYYFVVTVKKAGFESEKSHEVKLTTFSSYLNGTGIRHCGDYAFDTSQKHNNNRTCSQSRDADGDLIPKGQDGHYGAGKSAYKGMVFSPVKGHKGQCLQDEHTGLMWELKQNHSHSLHYKNHTYSWYNPKVKIGKQNAGKCTGSRCDTSAFIMAVNAAKLCGYNDWRIPNREELRSIVDYSRFNPVLDRRFFPNTLAASYWTSSQDSTSKSHAWTLNFKYGDGYYNKISNPSHIRLVRGKNKAIKHKGKQLVNGTTTHKSTGLMWKTCSEGQVFNGETCKGKAQSYNWKDALNQAEVASFAGYDDWRLPNIKELASIVEINQHKPAINKHIFFNTPSAVYWSSSPHVKKANSVWAIDFSYGYSYHYNKKHSTNHIRLVRTP